MARTRTLCPLATVYQQADAFAPPWLAQSAAIVLHESMASGLPCIVSEIVGCTLRDGVEGLVIPVGDVAALKDRISRLYRDLSLRRAMGLATRARMEQFTWEQYGRRLAMVYQSIASGERKDARGVLDFSAGETP